VYLVSLVLDAGSGPPASLLRLDGLDAAGGIFAPTDTEGHATIGIEELDTVGLCSFARARDDASQYGVVWQQFGAIVPSGSSVWLDCRK